MICHELNNSSVTVHSIGALNLTEEWVPLTNSAITLHVLTLTSGTQRCSTSVQEGTINIVRIDVASATANGGAVSLIVPSSHLQAEPSAQVTGGLTTHIVVMPHVVCAGNGKFLLTPELTATSTTSKD